MLKALVALLALPALLLFSTPAGAATPLLPGEGTTSQGVPSFIFGTQSTIDYGSPNVDTLPSVQAHEKTARLTLDRLWAYGGDSDAYITQKVQAAKNAGMTCMFMLGETDDLTWLEHVVTLTEASCPYYEFGNEPDNGGSLQGTIANYTSEWISAIPQLRALDPTALFGGPALTWSDSNNTNTSSYPNDMSYFLATASAAGVLPDFVTYHDYPCSDSKQPTMASCLSATKPDFTWNYNIVKTAEQTYLGHQIPTGVTEYNFDPGTGDLYNWAGNGKFVNNWTKTAINAFVHLPLAFANQFTSLNYSAYGDLDMFNDFAPYAPKPQFKAMQFEVAKYGG